MEEHTARARPPSATYRLQLHSGFTFADAARAVPYLAQLGVSHLYLSPIWEANPGSTHGYDVIDHGRVSAELGGLAGLYALQEVAAAHGLGIILDIVPNHVGINQSRHPWWRDVLRYGPASKYAAYFDIDWQGQPQMPSGRLVYPILGRPFGAALEAGELQLAFDGAELVVRYYEHAIPLAPATYGDVLGLPPVGLGAPAIQQLVAILDDLRDAPPDGASLLLHQFAALVQREAALRAWVDERLQAANGTPGVPASFDHLDAILRDQHYRLAYWRVSAEEINYRRFFDINDLAAIRVERDEVFEATHRLLQQILEAGLACGVRIDHVDGLYDPGRYLPQLRAHLARDGWCGIWVEKILAHGESLPASWDVAGTTGYDFLAVAGGLFIDRGAEQAFDAIYQEYIGAPVDYEEIKFAARRRIAGRSFAGEVSVLALQLHRLAQAHRLARDNTLRGLREAIAALLSCFPVYRTYLDGDSLSPGDREVIHGARDEALARDPNVSPEAMDFLVSVLLLEGDPGDVEERARRVHFRRRFQQLSGPVMAKGVEDTTFFRYHRLLALNEVGAHPELFGTAPAEAHAWFARRAETLPASMNATTTHDTKRSEDVRSRLAVLTQVPRQWRNEVRSWTRLNRRWERRVGGATVPGPNTAYYLYQTIVGSWPGRSDRDYVARIEEHMIKAAREAKLQTGWTSINEPYEAALRGFVHDILSPRRSGRFLARVHAFVEQIRPWAATEALALLAVKCTAPGFPDLYQGSEGTLLTLTDPDNRRVVDFEAAAVRLRAALEARPAPASPLAKTWLTSRLLGLRTAYRDAFAGGSYEPLGTAGAEGERLFAFVRRAGGEAVTVVVPRLVARMLDSEGNFRQGVLQDTTVCLPPGHWGHWLDGGALVPGGETSAASLLEGWPIAVLVQRGSSG
jgi:(1->4)-alpha-D-glucan 1-alpha-D-glucosylmutase